MTGHCECEFPLKVKALDVMHALLSVILAHGKPPTGSSLLFYRLCFLTHFLASGLNSEIFMHLRMYIYIIYTHILLEIVSNNVLKYFILNMLF